MQQQQIRSFSVHDSPCSLCWRKTTLGLSDFSTNHRSSRNWLLKSLTFRMLHAEKCHQPGICYPETKVACKHRTHSLFACRPAGIQIARLKFGLAACTWPLTPDPWKAVALSSLARPAETVDLPYGGKREELVRTRTINTYTWLDSERIKFFLAGCFM